MLDPGEGGGERGEGVERQSEERERVCKERLLVLHVTDR